MSDTCECIECGRVMVKNKAMYYVCTCCGRRERDNGLNDPKIYPPTTRDTLQDRITALERELNAERERAEAWKKVADDFYPLAVIYIENYRLNYGLAVNHPTHESILVAYRDLLEK